MKMLVIGMDGGHIEAFQRGWTPFIASLIERSDVADIHEDLIGRGWSKIVTGEDATITGATYDRPDLDGTHGWSLNFKLNDIPGIGTKIKPIWQKLNERGHKVGIMHVPTSFPAPKVNGFFISGGGGGKAVIQDPTPELCYPICTHKYLLNNGYIVDERLGSLLAEKKLYDENKFFERLLLMARKRAEIFTSLAQDYNIDFGFVVFQQSTNIAEFLVQPEINSALNENRLRDSSLINAAQSFYAKFDKQIKKLCNSFPDAEIILTSDHGRAVRNWSFNPNALLQDIMLQKPSEKNRGVFDIILITKKLIPFSLRTYIRNTRYVKKAFESLVTFNSKESKAFSTLIGDCHHGIWVNDDKRFGGPVTANEVENVKSEIVKRISANSEARKHNVTATVRANLEGAIYFPDVILDIPDGYVSSNDSKIAFKEFKTPNGPHKVDIVTKGQLLSGKSSKAMAVLVDGKWDMSNSTPNDLTIVHNHILSRFT